MALGPGLTVRVLRLASAVILILVPPLVAIPTGAETAHGVTDATAFRRALGTYEEGVFELTKSTDPEERAAAIKALTALASPKFPAARHSLIDDSSPAVRAALAQAIGQMGDDSPEGVAFLERMLMSTDKQVVDAAVQAEVLNLRAPLRFAKLWTPAKANSLWADGWQRTASMKAGLVVGVAEAKPWLDPAWKDLAASTQISLLLRAGTRESVPMAISLTSVKDAPRFIMPCAEEPLDLAYIHDLLKDPSPGVKRYALLTLKDAKDAAFHSGLHTLVQAYQPGDEDIPSPALGPLGLGGFLPDMADEDLLLLLSKDPGKWFWNALWTLERRGQPLSYADLRGHTQPRPLFDASKVKPDLLRSAQLRALLRENLYGELLDALAKRLPNASSRTSGVGDLVYGLRAAKTFRVGLPLGVAQACRTKVKSWEETTGAQLQPSLYSQEKDTLQELVDLLATPKEREEAWQTFRKSKDPLGEQRALQILKSGVSQRDQAIQQLLSEPQGGVTRLNASGPSDPCGRLGVEPWLTDLPAPTPALENLRRDFSRATIAAGIREGIDFARAFLESKAVPVSDSDPMPAARGCCNPAYPVRMQAVIWLDAHFRPGLEPPDISYQGDCKAWLEACQGRLRNWNQASSSPPVLSEEDRRWIAGVLLKRRATRFGSLVDALIHPKPSDVIFCGGPRGIGPASPGIWQPSDVFIREANIEYEPEIRDLLKRPEPIVRHAAALALWKLLRDPAALEVFKKDARSPDVNLRASSLNTLQRFRRKEEAALFPPLLTDKDPLLRQAGLAGVQAFSLRDTLPDVLSLVADSNGTTSAMAVDTLGLWESREALPLLVRLVIEDGPRASSAALALTHFRAREDLDHLLALAADTKNPGAARIRFLGVFSQITRRQGLQYCDIALTFGRNQKLEPATLQEWQSWWSAHREEDPERRFRDILAEQVSVVMQSKDDARSNMARAMLKSLFPGGYCLDGPGPTASQCRDTVAAWWASCKTQGTWSIIANPQASPWSYLDVLWDIDPKRAQKLLFSRFYQAGLVHYDTSLQGWSQDYPHTQLVLRSGVDFGDPGVARCGAKDQILADWLAWARREGWAE